MSTKGGPVSTFSVPGGKAVLPFAPRQLRHCLLVIRFWKIRYCLLAKTPLQCLSV